MMKKTLVLVGCVLLIGLSGTSWAQLISEDFDSVTTPALPAGWTTEDANSDMIEWRSYTGYACSGAQVAEMLYNGSLAMDDWLFTPAVALSSGHTYTLTFNYRVASGTYPETLTVFIGTSATSAAMTTTLIDVGTVSNTVCAAATVTDFTVPAVGTYYIGFWGHSAANEWHLVVDDVLLTETSTPVEISSFTID